MTISPVFFHHTDAQTNRHDEANGLYSQICEST